jgi:hypothetical protein
MRSYLTHLVIVAAVACFALGFAAAAEPEKEASGADTRASKPATVEEARDRARLLHEVIRGALQVMHRDFFDPDDKDRIPSSSLEDMFEVVEEEHGVKLRWLGVNAKTMKIDHKAKDDFEHAAVAALSKGAPEHEAIEGDNFRFVGTIRLHNACLKCHVPHRKSLETRAAGLAITIPLVPKE